jgi:hypothetical protein
MVHQCCDIVYPIGRANGLHPLALAVATHIGDYNAKVARQLPDVPMSATLEEAAVGSRKITSPESMSSQ